jgi:hypothetical protein
MESGCSKKKEEAISLRSAVKKMENMIIGR